MGTDPVERPIPDGYIHIQYREPISDYFKYFRLAEHEVRHHDIENEYNMRYQFAEMRNWDPDHPAYLKIVTYDNGIELIPWVAIQNVSVKKNSDEYCKALREYALACDHDWKPYTDQGTGVSYKYCSRCDFYETQIQAYEQQKVDEERNLA